MLLNYAYDKNDFFFLQKSTKNYSVTHFSVSTFIELPKTKTEKNKDDWRKKRRAVEEKEKDPLKEQSSKRKKLKSL